MTGAEGTGRGRGRPAARRGRRLAVALLLLLLVLLLMIAAMRHFHAGRGGGGSSVVRKAPPPPARAEAKAERSAPRPPPESGAAAPRRDEAALLAETRREVRVRGAERGDWEPASPGRRLEAGDSLRTSRSGGASIRMAEGAILGAGENTHLALGARAAGGGREIAIPSLVLRDGEIRILAGGTGKVSLAVDIPAAKARVLVEGASRGRSAEVVISVSPDGTAAVSVLSGAAVVAAQDRSARIGAGTFTTVARGAPPAPAEPLPPPPDLAAPPDGASFLYGTLPPRISFSWTGREQDDGYRFVLARDPDFRRIVLDERLAGCRVTQSRLEEGTYYWRVSAIERGAIGPAGDVARLRIVHRGTPPPLSIGVVARLGGGDVCLVTGRTEPGVKVFVAGTPVPVTGTGSFSCRLRVDRPAGVIVVEAVDPLGNVAYASRLLP